jgi:hypothetical protein
MRSAVLSLLAALCLPLAGACDGGAKDDAKKDDAKKDDAKKGDAKDDAKKDDAKEADAKEPDAKEAEPEAPKVVACDQRDFIPEGDKKMAEAMGKEAKPKLVCMDYSNRKESLGAASCAQGTALETPCPDEGVIATCTMEATGAVNKHYEGADLNAAERMCKTIEGAFAKM